MGFPKDIINIIRCIKSKDEKKRLNKQYHNKFRLYKSYISGWRYICYKNNDINYRDITRENYRKVIVNFLTGKTTKYCVPKNY